MHCGGNRSLPFVTRLWPGQFGNKTIHHGEKNGPAFYENGLKGSTSLDKKKSLMILR